MNGARVDGATNLPEYILNRIANFGDQVAQVDSISGSKLTYTELWLEALQIGHRLRQEGVGVGSVVGICMSNCLEYISVFVGVLQAGAVAALYSPGSTARELEHLISLTKPEIVISTNLNIEQEEAISKLTRIESIDKLKETLKRNDNTVPVELCPAELDSPAILLASSGSTGLPKAVLIKHSSLLWTLTSVSNLLMEKGQPALGLMPFYHAYGLGLMLMALCEGSELVIMNKFSLKEFTSSIVQYKIGHLHIVNSLLLTIASESVPKKSLKSIRGIFTGAGPVAHRVQESVLEKLEPEARLYHSYGMTETTHIVSFGEMRADKPGSPGRIISCMKAKIMNSSGEESGPGERGELWLQGPMLASGYLNNPAATEESFTSDRWLKTGDMAYIDSDGYLFIIDRIKEIIKFQGYQISVTELEQVISEQEGVSEVAVIGVEHEKYGEVPRAYIVPDNKTKVTEDQIQEAVSRELSHYKRLRGGIQFVDSLPKTQSMKINRKLLRSMQ